MERLETTTRTIKDTTHHFYCDECNKYLGKTKEYDDGYYPKLGEFELKFYINGWYKVEKCFCDKCKEKFIKKTCDTLTDLGFEAEK